MKFRPRARLANAHTRELIFRFKLHRATGGFFRALEALEARCAGHEARLSKLGAVRVIEIAATDKAAPEDGTRRWLRLREASAQSGYSISGLRLLAKRGRIRLGIATSTAFRFANSGQSVQTARALVTIFFAAYYAAANNDA